MPPYEWYNDTIAAWSREMGIQLVNFTPGTQSNQDWTYPELGDKYYPSDQLYENILRYEQKEGLNGFNLLIHMGTDPRRQDKLYDRLDELIGELKQRGYQFTRIDQTAY
jgi:peptidoglycan/xylan/chitin deacetylase (PgdA/CDA1 family)